MIHGHLGIRWGCQAQHPALFRFDHPAGTTEGKAVDLASRKLSSSGR
jgi:hypothetical protein